MSEFVSILSLLLRVLHSPKHGCNYVVPISEGRGQRWTNNFYLERDPILLFRCGETALRNVIEGLSFYWNFANNDLLCSS